MKDYIYVDNSSSAQKKLDNYIDKLGRIEIESQIFSEYDEQFQSFLLLSLLFLALDVMLMERKNHLLQKFTFFTKKK
jgi:Ca-activated chloride channel family protein